VALADLPTFPAFRAHATKIFHVIDDAVTKKNWDDVDKLSQFHKKIGATDKTKFNAFRKVFIDFLHLDGPQTGAWNKALDKFFHHLFSAF
jgi:hypothetical protein